MEDSAPTIKINKARPKLTRLDRLLEPGEMLPISRRCKAYACIELIDETDTYGRIPNIIENLPQPLNNLQAVAQNDKITFFGI